MREPDRYGPEDFGIGRLFFHIRDAVIVANAATERIVLWNDCATQIFGYSEREALEIPLHTLVPEDLRDRHRRGLAAYQDSGTGELVSGPGRVVELRGLHKDGHEFPIELTLTKIPEQTEGSDRFAMAIVRDATDRKAAEEARLALHDAELRQRQALQVNDDIVQGLVVASMALDLGEHDKGKDALRETIHKAQKIVSDLLESLHADREVHPGDLVRKPDLDEG